MRDILAALSNWFNENDSQKIFLSLLRRMDGASPAVQQKIKRTLVRLQAFGQTNAQGGVPVPETQGEAAVNTMGTDPEPEAEKVQEEGEETENPEVQEEGEETENPEVQEVEAQNPEVQEEEETENAQTERVPQEPESTEAEADESTE